MPEKREPLFVALTPGFYVGPQPEGAWHYIYTRHVQKIGRVTAPYLRWAVKLVDMLNDSPVEMMKVWLEAHTGHWDEHADFPVSDWQAEVANDETRQSYREWLMSRAEIMAGDNDEG